MVAILLSHHRTGSTAIRQALERRLHVFPGEPLESRLLCESFPWEAFFEEVAAFDVLHFHREHVDILRGWEAIARRGAAIVHLTRQSCLQQALSFERATRDQVWQGHPRGNSHRDPIELDVLIEKAMMWAALEAKAEFHLRDLPALRISYEEFALAPQPSIDRIVAFIESHV